MRMPKIEKWIESLVSGLFAWLFACSLLYFFYTVHLIDGLGGVIFFLLLFQFLFTLNSDESGKKAIIMEIQEENMESA